jgi:hypothetical protein
MNQRRDSYRAALRRQGDTTAPRAPRVTTLNSRYVRVTVELDPALEHHLSRWVGPSVSVVRAAVTRLTALAR